MQRVKRLWLVIIILAIVTIGCEVKELNYDTIIIGKIYETYPKFLSAPPDKNGVVDKTKGIIHNYAINKNYFSDNIDFKDKSSFFKYKSDKLFDKINLVSSDLTLVKELKISNLKGKIDEVDLKRFLSDKLIFLNSRIITKEDEKKYNINRVLTFSKPVYNDNKTKAALYVINYGSSLDSSLSVYILYKTKDIWTIKYTKPILIS